MLTGTKGFLRGRAIGRGSSATVYLAAATSSPQEIFAVKSAELCRAAPLQREHRILSSLNSQHLVACLGAGVAADPDGRVFYNLLMEYVPGGTLAEEIKRPDSLEEGSIRWYTRGILHGLTYLHSMGIAHCDVKGQNILVGAGDGRVKLADLGCARWVAGDSCGKIGGTICGTPLYMSPEVARGEEQGTAADIWALGCTVIEMATGLPPWPDVADPVAALHRIAFSTDVPELPRDISSHAMDFLGKCLLRDPAERWSAEQLLNHPFVKCEDEFAEGCQPEAKKKVSPRSTLERGFWDAWTEEEEEVAGSVERQVRGWPSELPEERLRQLTGVAGSRPTTSTSDESSWITVRAGMEPGSGCNSECSIWLDSFSSEDWEILADGGEPSPRRQPAAATKSPTGGRLW